MTTHGVAIDTAGGQGGGAGRFRAELMDYLSRAAIHDVTAMGGNEYVTPSWLARREWLSRGRDRVIAANNVSFLFSGSQRWVLARNANHFLTDSEWESVAAIQPPGFLRQVRMVRRSLLRADVIVVPSSEMADRVTAIVPRVADRLSVRFHPFTSRTLDREPEPMIVCPIVDSPYKRMTSAINDLLVALRDFPDMRLVWTSGMDTATPEMHRNPQLRLIGTVGHAQLAELYRHASAIYYPTEIESFGYPLAEARAQGIPVIARDTQRVREIAGPALASFSPRVVGSLHNAVAQARAARLTPDPGPFDPDRYFDWLLRDARPDRAPNATS